jgi:hypothetical protein
MSATDTTTRTTGIPAAMLARILDEGYGSQPGAAGAWYGSDLRAAIAGVKKSDAFKRPGKGRHNIAEVALHHAYWVGQIDSKLTGAGAGAFPLVGEDWFELDDEKKVSWSAIVTLVDASHQRLGRTVGEIAGGKRPSPLSESERFDLLIGITGHAAYHAGQIQLIKKLI